MTHIYEVGMGSGKAKVKAETPAAAAMYYGLMLVDTNNPFMAVVYTEDGNEWEGDMFWFNLRPDEAHVEKIMTPLLEQIKACEFLERIT